MERLRPELLQMILAFGDDSYETAFSLSRTSKILHSKIDLDYIDRKFPLKESKLFEDLFLFYQNPQLSWPRIRAQSKNRIRSFLEGTLRPFDFSFISQYPLEINRLYVQIAFNKRIEYINFLFLKPYEKNLGKINQKIQEEGIRYFKGNFLTSISQITGPGELTVTLTSRRRLSL
jgi:hypothetical protein